MMIFFSLKILSILKYLYWQKSTFVESEWSKILIGFIACTCMPDFKSFDVCHTFLVQT